MEAVGCGDDDDEEDDEDEEEDDELGDCCVSADRLLRAAGDLAGRPGCDSEPTDWLGCEIGCASSSCSSYCDPRRV